MSKVIRSVKNVTKGYSSVQVKVREATSNDPWGPTGTQMSEIAQLTYNSCLQVQPFADAARNPPVRSTEFYEIMDMLDKRLNDKGKNWRHVLKALKVMDYCLHEGSELVVTWAKQNIFIIKTLREFIYIDEEGKDVGANVRIAAKELSALIADEERLRAERTDRRIWKSRVNGLDEYAPQQSREERQQPRRERRQPTEEEDAEYKLAIEASKFQEEEDRKKRESRNADDDDDDLAKAIKLSKEEEERRRRELESTNAAALFDDTPTPTAQPQFTGFNQGYQQGSAVDFFANPIEQNQMQMQPTGYVQNAYTGYGVQQPQPTGYQNGFQNGFGQQPNAFDPYGQQQQHQQQAFQPQPTGYNPYLQQQQQQQQQFLTPQIQESTLQPGSNNPWASNHGTGLQSLKPTPTGSNNPFAQRPSSAFKATSSLGSLPEQKTLSTFSSFTSQPVSQSQPQFQSQPSFQIQQPQQPQQQPQQPQREMTEHEARLNALLSTGEGLDTFGNTGNLRIPAQHTAPGVFVNSAGAGLGRVTADATGNNPFLRQQFTGMPTVSYGAGGQQMPAATGPGAFGGVGGGVNNPFAQRQQQQQQGQGDLIQF
ncbi:putative epsin-like protein ent1/2 [Triangularia setosa]|uniref:Epsin-like protein ent1/2 n=1 Tax=Triangularia setosa TaxID=2587417 RepID=A0AAN6W7H5_9PEZI|nr:putative epsin-like protein ent1/2 [Podospora setosa]